MKSPLRTCSILVPCGQRGLQESDIQALLTKATKHGTYVGDNTENRITSEIKTFHATSELNGFFGTT
jgi:hypothetical protein